MAQTELAEDAHAKKILGSVQPRGRTLQDLCYKDTRRQDGRLSAKAAAVELGSEGEVKNCLWR